MLQNILQDPKVQNQKNSFRILYKMICYLFYNIYWVTKKSTISFTSNFLFDSVISICLFFMYICVENVNGYCVVKCAYLRILMYK